MVKKTIKVNISEINAWKMIGKFENILQFIIETTEKYENLGYVGLEFLTTTSPWGDLELSVRGSRLETDSECMTRIQKQRFEKRQKTEKEVKQYMELENKYGNLDMDSLRDNNYHLEGLDL